MFHSLDYFGGTYLDILQQVSVSSVLRTSHLNAVLQVRSKKCWVGRAGSPPSFCWSCFFWYSPGTVGLLGFESTLLAHDQLAIHPHVLFSSTMLYLYIVMLVLIVGVAITRVKDFAFVFVERYEVHVGQLLSLCRFLWIASCPLGVLTVPHNMVSATDLLTVSVSLMKILKCVSPSTDPWGTPFVTDLPLDIEMLTAIIKKPLGWSGRNCPLWSNVGCMGSPPCLPWASA